MLPADAWEGPFFKLLAKNDSGDAQGHQSGVVIPKDLDKYFPDLSGHPGISPSVQIVADLYLNGKFIDRVETRYQYQTWAGTRSPERRITSNLQALLSKTEAGDLFLIERNILDEYLFRLSIVSKHNHLYGQFLGEISQSRWGVLPSKIAVKTADVEVAYSEMEEISKLPDFDPFKENTQFSTYKRIVRDRAFRRLVANEYKKCAFCELSLVTPSGRLELEAAHIISVSANGSDDLRNGLGLCRTHHWAFDNGLLSISDDHTIIASAKNAAQNAPLISLQGRKLSMPSNKLYAPALSAINWHREKIFIN